MVKRLSITTLTVMLLLVGCRQGSVDSARLVELDSLIAMAPDSAAALLEAMPSDSLLDPESRAYHALLLTQARYKAYIPATSDSAINIAVARYDEGGSYDRRLRSLIYKGCVMTELGQPDSAMHWFKRAETAAHPDDHANLGYINFRMGRLYQNQYSDISNTKNKYANSIRHYSQNSDSSRLLLSLVEMGCVYRFENNDSAIKYLDQAEQIALGIEDTLSYYSCLANKAYAYYLKNDYVSAKRLAVEVLSVCKELPDSVGTIMVAAMAFAKLGQTDSANYFARQLALPQDSATQVLYYDMCAQVCQARHDQLGYLKNIRQSESIAGDLLSRSLQHKLLDIERDSQLHIAEADSKHAQQQSRFIATLAIMLSLLVGFAFALWQKKKRLEVATKQNEISNLYFELKEISQRRDMLSQQNEELSRQNKELSKQTEELSLQNDKLSHTSQELARKVEMAEKDISTIHDQLLKNQQVID